MGTRSLTRFYDGDRFLCAMYRQYDGYLSGHGKELKDYLKKKRIINGIKLNDTWENSFNGMGCLAASVISHFKKDIGNIYIYPEEGVQEYNYDIWNEGGSIFIEVWTMYKKKKILYRGDIWTFKPEEDEK